jgi:hypothetical protein
MEPEASNTIMASSVQGEGFFSSAPEADMLHPKATVKAMTPIDKL